MTEWLFWLVFAGALYSYFFYPLLLLIFCAMRGARGVAASSGAPLPLTLIITAYNERQRIRAKLDNALAIDYPGLQVIVASDCSSDGTDEIVREYASHGVVLVRAAERLGKENAQHCAIGQASGEVLVFSDVATQIPADALRRLAVHFNDCTVGAVSSEDRFIAHDGVVAGEGAYVRYEMALRRLESRLAGLVGLSGSFFAARRTVCREWDIHSPSDFNTALNCARLGLRAITAPDVLGFYRDLADPHKEYQRKVRTALRGMTAIARHPDVLNPLRFGLFAWQVWSHKLMRWAVPWLLAGLFALNCALASNGGIYLVILVAQLAFYGVATAAHFSPVLKEQGAIRIVYFFVQVNLALADALRRCLSGNRMTTWQPSSR